MTGVQTCALPIFKVPDLINGITYQMRVTPVLINGKTVDELATTLTATPNGSGFTPGNADPIPGWKGGAYTSSSAGHPAAGYPKSGAIIGEPGIPQMAAVAILIIAGLFSTLLWQHRRHRAKVQSFLQMMDMRYHQ